VAGWLLLDSGSDGHSGPPRAAIVDQLGLTFPNPGFVENVTATLERAGYQVDYIPGAQVNVVFYEGLPERNYDIVIFRVHSDRLQGEWQGQPIDETVLFSAEPFDEKKYLDDRAQARLTSARYFEGSDRFFGIAPTFVEQRMKGRFHNTLVIAMGCDGLSSQRTAEAFLNKGAGTFVGWDELVTADHTDASIERFVQHVVGDGLTPQAAVSRTMEELGPDPAYNSFLRAFPTGS